MPQAAASPFPAAPPGLRRAPWLPPWLWLLAVSALVHLWRLAYPAEVVFDEALVGRFASFYAKGEYYFDIHPPHMKLIYAALAALAGQPAGFDFPAHEVPYPTGFYVWLRLFPALCGTALPLLITRLALDFGAARRWAFCAGWMAVFDTALLAESRFILNDVPMLAFGLAGWCCAAAWLRRGRKRHALLCGLALAAACGVKWTALGFVLPALAALLLARAGGPVRRRLQALALAAAVGLAFQAAGYALHFALLPKAGPGDAFMSAPMQARLQAWRGNPGADPLFIPYATLELHRAMAFHASRVAAHPYASAWYSWPWGWRGIYFWHDRQQPPARIYLAPNLAVWWPLAAAALYFMAALLPPPWRRGRAAAPQPATPATPALPARPARSDWLLALAFVVNYLPLAFIQRPMFIYHYFPALAVSYVMAARLATCASLPQRWPPLLLAGAALLGFAWLAPVVYGCKLPQPVFDTLMFLKSWH